MKKEKRDAKQLKRLEQKRVLVMSWLVGKGYSCASNDEAVLKLCYGIIGTKIPARFKSSTSSLLSRYGHVMFYLGILNPGQKERRHHRFGAKSPEKLETKPQGKSEDKCHRFYRSYDWRKLRYSVIKRDGARCSACGATPKDGIVLHVDHIKPLRLNWELRLDPSNLQVLCAQCNHGKGNWDETDWNRFQDQVELG